jgi:Flp pilus assembly protein CpaB
MQKQKIILIIGIILGLAAVFMVNSYLDQQRRLMQEQAKEAVSEIQAKQSVVLIAKQDLPKGTVIDASMIGTKVVPPEYIQPQAATSLDRIVGMVTIVPIVKEEQITLAKLSVLQRRGGLAERTPVGKRAITINVDSISSLAGGMIKPGDYVDIISVIPTPMQTADGKQVMQEIAVPVFQNVLVLAVGQNTGEVYASSEGRYRQADTTSSAPSPLITFALTSQEANMLIFLQERSKIRLVLRSPADPKVEAVQPANWDTLFQYLMPSVAQQQPATSDTKSAAAEGPYVEIYRGLNKERVPLSK